MSYRLPHILEGGCLDYPELVSLFITALLKILSTNILPPNISKGINIKLTDLIIDTNLIYELVLHSSSLVRQQV